MKPGPRNLITDVDGILVGNEQDPALRSGVTVVRCETPSVAAVDVRGGAPGVRDTALLDPSCRVDRVDALCLSGGSAYGLSSTDGVMRWLRERGMGLAVGSAVVPIVPTAILFDLLNGGDKGWDWPPYRELAYAATGNAARDFALGTVGAGTGARAGNLKGGLGSASAVDPNGLQVGALVAVNAVGYATMGGGPHFWAWPVERGDEFGGLPPPQSRVGLGVPHDRSDPARADPRGNTTIAVVATNARLSKAEAERVAIMAQDGIARALRPAHTPADGDTVFVVATGRHETGGDPLAIGEIGTLAADCLARAIARGVYLATSLGAARSWRDVFGR
jgi:L-aminopeptidase/D-esterase-like protein